MNKEKYNKKLNLDTRLQYTIFFFHNLLGDTLSVDKK